MVAWARRYLSDTKNICDFAARATVTLSARFFSTQPAHVCICCLGRSDPYGGRDKLEKGRQRPAHVRHIRGEPRKTSQRNRPTCATHTRTPPSHGTRRGELTGTRRPGTGRSGGGGGAARRAARAARSWRRCCRAPTCRERGFTRCRPGPPTVVRGGQFERRSATRVLPEVEELGRSQRVEARAAEQLRRQALVLVLAVLEAATRRQAAAAVTSAGAAAGAWGLTLCVVGYPRVEGLSRRACSAMGRAR